MDFMNVLSLAIGMITVYLVFALSVTAFNEAIAALLSSRGKWLQRGVASLFSANARDAGNLALARQVYNSPHIAYLQRGRHYLPSYLPAWNLLLGMLDAAAGHARSTLATVQDLRQAAARLPAQSPIRVALDELLAAGDVSVDEFRKRYEAWFATFEAQVMAWYRQKTQLVVAGLSLLVVVALNVDTLTLVNQLSLDPKLREVMAQQGEDLSRAADLPALAASLPAAVASPAAAAASPAASAATAPTLAAVAATLQANRAGLAASGLKLGWTAAAWQHTRSGLLPAIEKLVGLLLSAFAVSLGAPFWFDLLKNLVAIRAVGKNLSEQQDARDRKARSGG